MPKWFIELFTDKEDWVLDPFVGSGTTCKVAQELGRNSVGIDTIEEYTDLAKANLKTKKLEKNPILFHKEKIR